MTPMQLLDSVKGRFHTLLHCEPDALNLLLVQSLSAYQDNAGVTDSILIKTVKKQDGVHSIDVPSDFLARVDVKDKTGNFISSRFNRATNELELGSSRYYLPLRFTYAINLRDADLDTYQLPPSCIGLVQDYLEILISIPNSERRRRVNIPGNLDVSDIPVEAELFVRKSDLEQRIKAARFSPSMISIRPM